MEDRQVNVKGGTDARVEHIVVPVADGYIRWHVINRGSQADSEGTVLDANSKLRSVATLDDGTIVESQARWNNAIGRNHPDGTGAGVDFDPGRVRDTFKGRLYGFFNRVKRRLD